MDTDTRPILIVDDDANDLALMVRAFGKAGVSNPLRTFFGGEHVVEYLTDFSDVTTVPLLLLADVKMHDMQGHEIAHWARDARIFDQMAIVLWSSGDDPEDIAQARMSGAQGYLLKSFSEERLRLLVTEARRFAQGDSGAFKIPGNLLQP